MLRLAWDHLRSGPLTMPFQTSYYCPGKLSKGYFLQSIFKINLMSTKANIDWQDF